VTEFQKMSTIQISSFCYEFEFCFVKVCAQWMRAQDVRCDMTLSSWAIDNRRLQLDFDGEDDINFFSFSESNEWMLIDSSALKDNLIYHMGEETDEMEFTQLTYSMTIRRRFGFYVYALIVPSVLLSFLMPLTFSISPSGSLHPSHLRAC